MHCGNMIDSNVLGDREIFGFADDFARFSSGSSTQTLPLIHPDKRFYEYAKGILVTLFLRT